MKRIKSNHLWRRGATLLLAMLMLFTCVGSALPAFAEEAAGNTATVDSGDPVLADSSASGDSTGDTGTDLPDDPQRPTLPSGEDISEEAPPADESDGETVPPADSDSSEDPAAPDSGDSIPDESESEPAEQPGEGDADLPEDEQPSGEEPDPDEDEEIPENEPEDEPFEALVILDPENGAAVQAGVGEEVTFKAPVSREDVAVAYQWQRFQKPAAGSVQTEALYDYAEGETTEYWYALDDMREAEALAMNPDMLWPGIEMYYATVAALDEIGADSSDVSIAWKTPNFALEGYTISAAETESGIEVYADKDDERHVAHLNENSEWEFGEAEEKPETTGAWLNIEGANGPEYAFTVEERDYDASFRCEVTVLDEVYLEQCLSILEEQGIELTEEQRAAEQKLYSVVMSVENGKEEALPEDEPMTFSMARSMLRAAASGKPQLSADAQWIEGLDGNYQYITKDTYDRVSEWLAKGEITETQRYAKDDDGKKRIERYTQLCTLILAVVMAVGYYFIARNYGAVKYTAGFAGVLCGVIVVSVFAAGAMTVQWLGTLIDARGIGSGLSMLIFAGIVSRWSGTVSVIRQIAERVAAGQWGYMAVGVFLLAFMLASLLYAVCLNAAEKRIPVQYAGKNGNRGAGSFIPVRLVTGGVMPVIFAGSVLGIPSMISLFVSGEKHPSLYRALTAFARGNWLYILLYAVLIFAFHRFYLAIQFDSTEIATNLRKRGGMIPGVRPGKPTADYLNRAIKGMADSGSLALVLVACLPMLLSKAFGISLQLGGTSLLIVVGVAIELAGQVDSQLTIRHHDGFLD